MSNFVYSAHFNDHGCRGPTNVEPRTKRKHSNSGPTELRCGCVRSFSHNCVWNHVTEIHARPQPLRRLRYSNSQSSRDWQLLGHLACAGRGFLPNQPRAILLSVQLQNRGGQWFDHVKAAATQANCVVVEDIRIHVMNLQLILLDPIRKRDPSCPPQHGVPNPFSNANTTRSERRPLPWHL